MNPTKYDWGQIISRSILYLAGALAVTVPILDIFGVLENVEWFQARISEITLVAIGLLIFAAVFERRTILDRIERLLKQLLDTQLLGVQYLPDRASVVRELTSTIDGATEAMWALGAKSTADVYLERIASKTLSGHTTYHRLLTGNHITHKLHEHLIPLIDLEAVQVAWNHSEKYGYLTVSDSKVMMVFPSPHPEKFTGLRLPGASYSLHYSQVFMQAFTDGIPVTSERGLSLLCEECSPNIPRDELQLTQALKRENELE